MNFDHYVKNLFLLKKDENIKSISVGVKTISGQPSEEEAIVYFVEKKIDEKKIDPDKIIPKTLKINGKQYKTDVVEGNFELIDCYAYSDTQKQSNYLWCTDCENPPESIRAHRKKTRPLIGGISIGNSTIAGVGSNLTAGGYGSAGTLGLIAIDKRDGCAVGITCAHVVCSDYLISNEKNNVNNTAEQIINQPAYFDCPGDICSDTAIGKIKRHSIASANPDYENYIDCALVSINNGLLDESSFGQLGFSSQELDWATEAECNSLITSNIKLYKSGRTTGAIGGDDCPIVPFALNASLTTVAPAQYKYPSILYQGGIIFRYAANSPVPDRWGQPMPKEGVAVGGDSGSALIGDFNGVKKIVGIIYAAGSQYDYQANLKVGVYGIAYPIYKLAEIMNVEPLSQTPGRNTINYSNSENWTYKTFDSDEPFIIFEGKKYWQIGTAITSDTPKLKYEKPTTSFSTETFKIFKFLDSNSANYSIRDYMGDQYSTFTTNAFINYVQTVGTNGAPSYYGTYDQSGNVFEWIDSYEASLDDVNTVGIKQRGGSFDSFFDEIDKNYYRILDGASDNYSVVIPNGGERIKGGPTVDAGFRLSSKTNPLNYLFRINELTNEFVNVSDASNQPDSDTGLGVVSYNYSIMKYTVTNQEYVEFLNSIDPEGTNSRKTYHIGMTYGIIDQNSYSILTNSSKPGGIDFISTNGNGNKYKVKLNMANKPAIYVSWYSAARFANWLHNRVDNPDSIETETGAYNLNGIYYNGSSNPPEANFEARYRIPTENEWYKAAYYSPIKNVYHKYAMQNNNIPSKVFTAMSYQLYRFTLFGYGLSDKVVSGNGMELFHHYKFYSSYFPEYNTGTSRIKGVEDLIDSDENDVGTGVEIISSSNNSLFYTPNQINCFNKNKNIYIYMNENSSPIATINYAEPLEKTGFGWDGISGVNLKNGSFNEFTFVTIKDGIKIQYDSFFNNQNLHFLNWSQDFISVEILPKPINYNRSSNIKNDFGNWGILRSVVNNNIWNN